MIRIIAIALAILFSLSGCRKMQMKKFEGTYSNPEYACNPSVTLSACAEDRICFDFKFGCWFVETLTCERSSSQKLIIEPIGSIGVMSQGGYQLFGGSVQRNKEELIIEIESIHYCDPNDPPWIECTAEKVTETFTYIRD